MKLAILLTILSFLLFAFITDLSLAKPNEPVLDLNGDPIVPGDEYYVVSAIWGAGGGGVRPGRTGNSQCPVSVIQERSDLNPGVPVKFTVSRTFLGIITPGTPLNIAFAKKPECAESSNWVVFKESNQEAVVIGGSEDHPNNELLRGHFTMDTVGRYEGIYKLSFCHRTTALSGSCSDIGRVVDENESRRLVLTDENPFPVVFVPKSARKSKIYESMVQLNVE